MFVMTIQKVDTETKRLYFKEVDNADAKVNEMAKLLKPLDLVEVFGGWNFVVPGTDLTVLRVELQHVQMEDEAL